MFVIVHRNKKDTETFLLPVDNDFALLFFWVDGNSTVTLIILKSQKRSSDKIFNLA